MSWGQLELEPEVEEWIDSLAGILRRSPPFRKQRMREVAEIERARVAMERCILEGHTADDGESA